MKFLMIILTAMFIGAKLCGAIGWSWWLVMSPLIVYVCFWAFVIILAFIVNFVLAFCEVDYRMKLAT